VLLSAFFSQTVVGYYSLATLILRLPVALIGRAIADVFFPQASIAYHEGKLAILVESTVGRLTALGLLPMLSLLIIGPEAFTIVLGSQWGEAGVYAQMLSPWILLVLVTSPITTTYIVSERQGTGLAFDIVLLFTRLASLVVGGVLKDARLALLLYGGSSAFIWVCLLAWLIHLSEASANRVLRDLSTALLYASPALCSLIAGRLWMHLPGWALLVTAACGAALYYALVSRRDPAVRRWAFSVYSRLVTRG
jgi:lipopolysaccharide exporter